jgi:acetylornithine deacetylase
MAMWRLEVEGIGGHSGMPQNCVNAFELAMAASLRLAEWFHSKYVAHPDEARWGFLSPSSLKSTVVSVSNDKVSKIPGLAQVQGDIRLTPFYDIEEAMQGAVEYIRALDRSVAAGEELLGFPRVRTADGRHGRVELRFTGRYVEGIACNLESDGLAALKQALERVRGAGSVAPFSMTGSLPLVRDLQRRGFDVQITGFGRSVYYHAPNEQALLQHFREGFLVLSEVVRRLG